MSENKQENKSHKNRYEHDEDETLSEEEFERRNHALYHAAMGKGVSLRMNKKSPKEFQYQIMNSFDIYSVWLDSKGKANLSWLGQR